MFSGSLTHFEAPLQTQSSISTAGIRNRLRHAFDTDMQPLISVFLLKITVLVCARVVLCRGHSTQVSLSFLVHCSVISASGGVLGAWHWYLCYTAPPFAVCWSPVLVHCLKHLCFLKDFFWVYTKHRTQQGTYFPFTSTFWNTFLCAILVSLLCKAFLVKISW